MVWQPIETFKTETKPWCDGFSNKVLASNGREIHICYASYDYDDDTGAPTLDGWRIEGEGFEFEPTHFAPLPDLPNKEPTTHD